MQQMTFMDNLMAALAPSRSQILDHPVYSRIRTLDDVRTFMEHHVFAVWDFMSLLTSLQRGLTCIELPWRPVGSPNVRRLINEIMLEEESDVAPEGDYTSHVELYLRGMRECGADTSKIDKVLSLIADRASLGSALTESKIPEVSRAFVETTWGIVSSGSMHRIAAAFTLGREKVIPDMFSAMISELNRQFPGQLKTFQSYLSRHVELDKERHSPMGLEMLQSLCGDDPKRWREATETAKVALGARLSLWDGIADSLTKGRLNEPVLQIGIGEKTGAKRSTGRRTAVFK